MRYAGNLPRDPGRARPGSGDAARLPGIGDERAKSHDRIPRLADGIAMRLSAGAWALQLLLAWSAAPLPACAQGTIEGTVALEAMKPATGPGYRVQTRNPVQSPDPQLAIVYLENDAGRYPRARADEIVKISQ